MLNEKQEEVKNHYGKNLLVIAGPGSGKTFTMISKIEEIIKTKKAEPAEVLVLTFTKKAAGELSARLQNKKIDGVETETFHSFCSKYVVSPATSIAGEKEKEFIFKNIEAKKKNIKYINSKKAGVSVPFDSESEFCLKSYNTELQNRNLIDFSDILINFLKDEKISINKKIVIVDEFQDTSVLQYSVLKKITKNSEYVCCVGDDHQSIYGFNGAHMENIEVYRNEFKADIIILENNYRSCIEVCDVANNLISCATKDIFKKSIVSAKQNNGNYEYIESRNMYKTVVDKALEFKEKGVVILCRGNAEIFRLRNKFENKEVLKIPYIHFGKDYLYDIFRAFDGEIKWIIDRFCECDFAGKVPSNLDELEKSHKIPEEKKQKLQKALSLESPIDAYEFLLDKKLDEIFKKWYEKLSNENVSFSDLFYEVFAVSEKIYNNNNKNKIEIITAHASKGLEWNTVIIPFFNKGYWPSGASEDWKQKDEERRVLYVAITRAEENLLIIEEIGDECEPSSFKLELK